MIAAGLVALAAASGSGWLAAWLSVNGHRLFAEVAALHVVGFVFVAIACLSHVAAGVE